jgi:phosphoribosylanthranilate isomerase
MTKIKICGITRPEDARLCGELGAYFIGFNFVPDSPRFIEPERAAEIATNGCLRVGVFRDSPVAEIDRIAKRVRLDVIQLHGAEGEDLVRAVPLPVIKALKVDGAMPDTVTAADWLLFDSGGGTGRAFDWTLLAGYPRTKPFFLAGGITPENVTKAIRDACPDAIDLASGVESAPGIKDHRKLRDLFERAQRA